MFSPYQTSEDSHQTTFIFEHETTNILLAISRSVDSTWLLSIDSSTVDDGHQLIYICFVLPIELRMLSMMMMVMVMAATVVSSQQLSVFGRIGDIGIHSELYKINAYLYKNII